MRRTPGFTLVEMMVVITIAGLLTSLAVPTLSEVARTFSAREQAQQVLSAIRAGRSLSQKRNEPIMVRATTGKIVLLAPTYVGSTDGVLVAIDTSAWQPVRTIALPKIRFHFFPADGLAFCPSGAARYRKGDLNGDPLCGLGDLSAPTADVTFEALRIQYTIRLNGALASTRLRLGS